MSDQTPETSEDQGHEPSMEDILSSIRQMIDADDIGVNVPIQEESGREESLEPTSLVKAVDSDEPPAQDKPVDPFDILESLAENDSPDDLEIPEIKTETPADTATSESATSQESIEPEAESVESASVELTVKDDLALSDDAVLILDEVLDSDTDENSSTSLDYVGIDDLEGDVDLIVDDQDETLLHVTRDHMDAPQHQDAKREIVETANVTGGADIDLVKSLMAGLTDDDMMEAGEDFEADHDESHLDLHETETELPSSSAFLAIARKASAEAEAVERGRASEPLNITPEAVEPESVESEPVATTMEKTTPTGVEQTAQLDDTAIKEADDDLEIWVVEVDDETESAADIPVSVTDIDTETITEHVLKDMSEIKEQETPTMARAAEQETILDDETEADTSSAFANLAQVVQQQEDGAYMGPHIGELVTEAMKPMLKEWLDKNLKGIVERAVTKEVKRISGGK